MTTVTEGIHYGAAILSYEDSSIEPITVAVGQNLSACHVVQKTHNLTACKLTMAAGTNTGNGTLTLAKAGHEVKTGTYTVTCTAAATHGGTFSVTDPDSAALPSFTLTAGAGLASWYWHPQIEFVITDGSTDFAVNDSFTIVVAAATNPTVVGTGNGTLTNVVFGSHALPGSYILKCVAAATHGGTFEITGTENEVIGTVVMTAGAGTATNYLDRRETITFTLTDGSTDFALNDYFCVIAVKAATHNHYTAWSVANGAHDIVDIGVLIDAVDATSAAKAGVAIVRNAEVAASNLQWSNSPTAGSKSIAYDALNRQGIAVRS